jgi:hypothetical protein
MNSHRWDRPKPDSNHYTNRSSYNLANEPTNVSGSRILVDDGDYGAHYGLLVLEPTLLSQHRSKEVHHRDMLSGVATTH